VFTVRLTQKITKVHKSAKHIQIKLRGCRVLLTQHRSVLETWYLCLTEKLWTLWICAGPHRFPTLNHGNCRAMSAQRSTQVKQHCFSGGTVVLPVIMIAYTLPQSAVVLEAIVLGKLHNISAQVSPSVVTIICLSKVLWYLWYFTVGLGALKSLFQPKWFCGSTICGSKTH